MNTAEGNRRILWLDDDRLLFDEVQREWPGNANYTLEWVHQAQSLKQGFGQAYEAVLNNPPRVLVFDWEDGAFLRFYRELKAYLPIAVLISSSGAEQLLEQGVFREFPEFEGRCLQKPFGAEQLLSLLRRLDLAADPPQATETPAPPPPPTLPSQLPLRYLNEQFVPLSANTHWRSSLNRPEAMPSAAACETLQKEGWAMELVYGVNPANPSDFALLQVTTYRLDVPLPDGSNHVQHVTPLPQEFSKQEGSALFDNGATVEGVMGLMRQLGFPRGRYYRLFEVPGLQRPLLELVVRTPDEPGLRPLPAAAEMDEVEFEQFDRHRHRYRQASNQDQAWIEVRQTGAPDPRAVNDSTVWDHYVNTTGVTSRLEVPLFAHLPSHWSPEGNLANHMVGMMVFDRGPGGGDIEEGAVRNRVSGPLLAALKVLAMNRAKATLRANQKLAADLVFEQREFARCNSFDELETALVKAAIKLASNGQGGTAGKDSAPQRSAIYARFDELSRELQVTADTRNVLRGAKFKLDQGKFFVVQAANAALSALNDPSRPAVPPVFVPDVARLFRERPDQAISAVDLIAASPSPQTDPGWAAAELQSIATAVALAVTAGQQLLGVLVVRSDRAHEFVAHRVSALVALVDSIRPFLAKQTAILELIDRSAMALHELRSHLTRVRNRIADGRIQPADEASRQALNDADLMAGFGAGLADLYLNTGGFSEVDDTPLSQADLWETVDAFGRLCARDHGELGWTLVLPQSAVLHTQPRRPDWLMRVMNVLVDNAFRHAQTVPGGSVECTVHVDPSAGWMDICVVNPGTLSRAARHLPGTSMVGRVGLTLAERACAKIDATLTIEPSREGSEVGQGLASQVRASLQWPLESSPTNPDQGAH